MKSLKQNNHNKELFYPDTSATAVVMTKMAKKLSQNFNVERLCSNTKGY